jgi:hypothetical protein
LIRSRVAARKTLADTRAGGHLVGRIAAEAIDDAAHQDRFFMSRLPNAAATRHARAATTR